MQPERGEDSRLEHVQQRQDPPQRELVDAGRQQRREQRRQELRGDEDRRRRSDGLGAVVDQHGQRDDADGVADLVDRVGRQQPSERTHAERSETPPRHTTALYPLARRTGDWTNVRSVYARMRDVWRQVGSLTCRLQEGRDETSGAHPGRAVAVALRWSLRDGRRRRRSRDWQPIELVGLLLVLAIGSDMLTVEVRGVRISGSFLAHRARDGAARPGAGRRDRRRLVARRCAIVARRPWDQRARRTSRPTRPSRSSAALLIQRAGRRRRARAASDGLGFARARAARVHGHELPQLRDGRRLQQRLARRRRSSQSVRTVYLTVLPVGVRDRPADRRRRVQLRPDRRRRRRPARGRAVRLPVPRPRRHPGLRARRGAREAHAELASLQVGLLTTVMQTLSMRDADDRAPLGRRRALLARGREDARASTSASRT